MALFAGTHNEESSYKLIQLAKQHNIDPDDQRLWFGQLYGMSDHISFNLAQLGFNTAKYVPFGGAKMLLLFVRRAEENTSVADRPTELNLIKQERKRRKLE